VKLFYNPTSKVPLIWPLLVLILGQLTAHGIHFLTRIWLHGSVDFNSYSELPKLNYTESKLHFHLWLVYIWIAFGLAGAGLLASAFSFKSWWIRVPYVFLLGMLGMILAAIIHLSYLEYTGLNWK